MGARARAGGAGRTNLVVAGQHPVQAEALARFQPPSNFKKRHIRVKHGQEGAQARLSCNNRVSAQAHRHDTEPARARIHTKLLELAKEVEVAESLILRDCLC